MKKVFFIFLFICFLVSSENKSLPLPEENIPENPPLQSSVILPDGKRFLLDYFDDIKVFYDKKEKRLKTNKPGWWIINFPVDRIEGFDRNLSIEEKSRIIFGKSLREIKNWYIYEKGNPAKINFVPSGPAPLKYSGNPTIIVNNKHPYASDENEGTYEKPLKTISKAIEKAKPGDIIHVYPGIYRENIKITKSGEKGKPIIIEGIRDKDGKMPVISGNEILPLKWEVYDKEKNIYKAEFDMNMMGRLIDEENDIVLREVDRLSELEENKYLFNWSSEEFLELTEKFEKEIIKKGKEIKQGNKFEGKEFKKYKVDSDGFIDFSKISDDRGIFIGVTHIYCDKEVKGRVKVSGKFRGTRMTGTGFSIQSNRYRLWINDVFVKGMVFSTYEKHFYLYPRHTPYYTGGGDVIDGFKLKEGWNTLYFIWDTNTKPKDLKFKFNFPKNVKLISSVEKNEKEEKENFIKEYLIAGPYKSKIEKAIYLCSKENPEKRKISIPARGNPLVNIGILEPQRKIDISSDYIYFRGFKIQGGGHFQQRSSIFIYGCGNLVEGCIIGENEAVGISFSNRKGISADPNIIRNNWIINPGNVGIAGQHTSEFLTAENQTFPAPGRGRTIIEYNYIKGANWLTLSFGWQAGGMKLFRLTNCIIRYNTVEDCPSQGIWLDFEHYNNRLEGNYINRCYFYGFGIEASPGANLVANNLIVGLKPIGPENVWFRYGILAWSTQRTWAINNTIDGKWDKTPCWQNKKGTDGILLRMNKKSKRHTRWEGNFAPDLMTNNLILGCKVGIIKGEDDFVENNFYEKGEEMSFIKRYYPEKAKEEKVVEKEFKVEDLINREKNDYRIKDKNFPESINKELPEFIKPHFKRYDFYGFLRFPEEDIVGAIRRWDENIEKPIIEIDFYDGRMIRRNF